MTNETNSIDFAAPTTHPPPRIGAVLASSLDRAERRCDGREKPIVLPWPVLADHFGGGLWPGLHFVNASTGVGKTQFALQVGAGAAKAAVPVIYIGLELGELDLAFRLVGEEARVPWSHLWTGKAGPAHIARARAAVPALSALPFHYEISRPMGFSAADIRTSIESLCAAYPETDGPGSRRALVVVDFLQLVGDEPGDERELRVRIGRAAYALRDAANRFGVAVLCISSIARERYKMMTDIHTTARLEWDVDADGCPINRRILDPDAIVGSGKEAGEIEFSADSVSVLARVPATWEGAGFDAVFATAKGRATGAMWSPLHFTGYRYEECSDRGGRMIQAWSDASDRRSARAAAKEEEKHTRVAEDARAVASYVLAHQGCTVTSAKKATVGDNSRRWNAVADYLGKSFSQGGNGSKRSCAVDVHTLPPSLGFGSDVRPVGTSDPSDPSDPKSGVQGALPLTPRAQSRTRTSPPRTPPASDSSAVATGGRASPVEQVGQVGQSESSYSSEPKTNAASAPDPAPPTDDAPELITYAL